MALIGDTVRVWAAASNELPLPGHGRTGRRLLTLFELAASQSLSVARLAEAHVDALAILAEADRSPVAGALYGVWASQNGPLRVRLDADGALSGTMRFASGLGIVDRALIAAEGNAGTVLVDAAVPIDDETIDIDLVSWRSPALTETATGSVAFKGHMRHREVMSADWYLERIGFWHGACAPAACWAGGAVALTRRALDLVDDNPHRLAHVGAMAANEWTLRALIQAAGDQIDADPTSAPNAQRIARALRFSVAETARDVLDRFSRAFGPRPVVDDPVIAQRCVDLDLYIRQHHSERELPAMTQLIRCDVR